MRKIESIVIVENDLGFFTAHLRFTADYLNCSVGATSKYMIYRLIENYLKKVRAYYD